MSIFKVNPSDYQSITVATNPSRYYSSGSNGVTGSIFVFSRRSSIEKDISELNDPETPFNESTLFQSLENIKKSPSKVNFVNLQNYLTGVNKSPVSFRKQTQLGIIRFTPTNYFTTGTLKKIAIKDNLSSYYRGAYPSAHWGYCNYHSLNFFSSSTVSTSSVLIYPNVSNRYLLTGAFSLDFHINPRYNSLDSTGYFKAGTIFHVSSSYALSLVTGSAKGADGLPSGFRLQLQLSHSADFSPSTISSAGSYPRDLVFLSDDNSLNKNHWHHVVVRWGTNKINHGTGSFVIDGVEKGTFVVPSSSLLTPGFSAGLCIGNFYEGNNSGNNSMARFFANVPAYNEGLYRFGNVSNVVVPDTFTFKHPLQAEVHNLSIKRFYVSDKDILVSSSTGISDLSNVAFYVPPFFTFDSHVKGLTTDATRKNGVVYTPAIATYGMTTTPFSVPMSFGVDGHYINTENFLKDFTSNYRPRQLFLSATLVDTSLTNETPANQILYNQQSVRKRNLMILPCDDGNFYPNYQLLSTGSSIVIDNFPLSSYSILNQNPGKIAYIDDLGNPLEGFISLNNMAATVGRKDSNTSDDKENKNYVIPQIGFRPSRPLSPATPNGNVDKALTSLLNNLSFDDFYNKQKNIVFSTAYKTADGSSNQVVFFDISNLFYGIRILPGSFVITDSNLSGSGGAISITIKDDGLGTLYRADSLTPHSTWNAIGTIFYNEGIIVIKSPHLYFFGENQYEMSFKGEQNIHVLRLDTLAPTNYLNSSSNPTYKNVPSTNRPNEPDPNFVYITGINFHDDNLNVVMKTQLAQPIMKRFSDKILFKVKYDF